MECKKDPATHPTNLHTISQNPYTLLDGKSTIHQLKFLLKPVVGHWDEHSQNLTSAIAFWNVKRMRPRLTYYIESTFGR